MAYRFDYCKKCSRDIDSLSHWTGHGTLRVPYTQSEQIRCFLMFHAGYGFSNVTLSTIVVGIWVLLLSSQSILHQQKKNLNECVKFRRNAHFLLVKLFHPPMFDVCEQRVFWKAIMCLNKADACGKNTRQDQKAFSLFDELFSEQILDNTDLVQFQTFIFGA